MKQGIAEWDTMETKYLRLLSEHYNTPSCYFNRQITLGLIKICQKQLCVAFGEQTAEPKELTALFYFLAFYLKKCKECKVV